MNKKFLVIFLLCGTHYTFCYDLPALNLGITNFLDGGPVRPKPGWYYFQYLVYYNAHKLLDANGNLLGNVPSPNTQACATIFQTAYQSTNDIIPNAKAGLSASLPLILQAKISANNFNICSSGAGFGDLGLGAYLQWNPTLRANGDPLFVHRLEFNISLPIGKNRVPHYAINPSNGFFFINPYWAATLFITQQFSLSWRLYYLWCFTDPRKKIKAGNAALLNYSAAYEIINNFYIGVNGYFLQQTTNSKECGIEIPNSRERVFAIGPGAVYRFSPDLYIFGHLYFESNVRNRPQGIRTSFYIIVHF